MASSANCVSVVLSDRAMDAARRYHFSKAVTQTLAEAPHCAEGTGVASRSAILGTWLPIRKQAQIKLATWPRKICQPFTPGSPAHDSMSLGLPLPGARGYCPYCPKSL